MVLEIVIGRCDAGTHRYNVGMDTPKFFATSRGGVPSCSNRFEQQDRVGPYIVYIASRRKVKISM